MKRIWGLVFVALVLFLGVRAFAAASGTPGAPMWALLMPLVSSALGLLAFTLKKLSTATTGFWHQWYGHLLAIFGTCMVSSGIDWLASGHLTKMTAVAAGVAGVSAFLALLMPTGKAAPSENAAPTIPVQKVG